MEIKLLDKAVCRTPVFSICACTQDRWDELKALIAESSPDFYEFIKDASFSGIGFLPEKVKTTLWKYFNRAKYRATPFGGFAAVSLATVDDSGSANHLELYSQTKKMIFPHWSEVMSVLESSPLLEKSTYLRVNSTIYTVGNEFRYIRSVKDDFQIASIPMDDLINGVVDCCRNAINLDVLMEKLLTNTGEDPETLFDVLNQLLEAKLIFSEQTPNITGPDYFERLRLDKKTCDKHYRIDQRLVKAGSISSAQLADIKGYLQFWRILNCQSKSVGLDEFRIAFKKKFSDNFVQLSHALDPEIGIGYGQLGEQVTGNIANLSIEKQQSIKKNSNSRAGQISDEFLGFLIGGMTEKSEIHLEEYAVPSASNIYPFPNTFSAMVSFIGKQPLIESAGGCTANNLLGRFTVADAAFEELARDFVHIEREANPEVLFFEIAYAHETEIDNVNRRLNLYEYEMPLFTWSVTKQPLHLSDIWVCIRNDEVILWSATHQKRMVPRMSSAYNSRRSGLALFRFLSDLQYQNLSSELSFKLSEILPGCQRYPRVCYKDVIASPAMWKVPKRFKTASLEEITQVLPLLKKWFAEQNVSRFFKFGSTDQTLTFDTCSIQDLKVFLTVCRQANPEHLFITETAEVPELISDEAGRRYNPQVILNYYHNKAVYTTLPMPVVPNIAHSQESQVKQVAYMPGSVWVYFEIFCHPIRSNSILTCEVQSLLSENNSLIEKWFFIRYDVTSPHIRLRFKLKNKRKSGIFLTRFEEKIKPILLNMQVSDVQIKTYFPESSRYDLTAMDLIESIFWLDSALVIQLLNTQPSQDFLYLNTIYFMQAIFDCLYTRISDKIELAVRVAVSFATELYWDNRTFKKLNADFKSLNFRLKVDQATPCNSLEKMKTLIHQTIALKTEKHLSEKLIIDIIHMHINRVYATHQRVHEGVLYQYLTKYLKTQAALLKYVPV